jgi:hypothetical protein
MILRIISIFLLSSIIISCAVKEAVISTSASSRIEKTESNMDSQFDELN